MTIPGVGHVQLTVVGTGDDIEWISHSLHRDDFDLVVEVRREHVDCVGQTIDKIQSVF